MHTRSRSAAHPARSRLQSADWMDMLMDAANCDYATAGSYIQPARFGLQTLSCEQITRLGVTPSMPPKPAPRLLSQRPAARLSRKARLKPWPSVRPATPVNT